MNSKEAILRLKGHFIIHDDGRPTPYLDEAANEAYKALEKQISKKPKWGHHCPNCENGLEVPELLRTEYKELCIECCYPKYCPNCGQAIDWSDADE